MLSVSKKLVSVSLTWEGGSALGPQLALSWRKGEGRRWSTREGWHDSPVMQGGWPGWTASGHSTSCHGEVKTVGDLPTKVGTTRVVRGGWPGWTASGHSTSHHGEVKTVGGLLAKVGTTRLSCGTW
ncbi:hypothetical protein CRG98_018882 [Punica granatum]|nr:hypothetical protein CRG98_018882 [Punica granatum]